MMFSEPADVNGTKFLTLGHRGEDSDQRLYLPALKKVRKISASGKDGEFVNSDLWFYDLEERYFEDNTYTYLSENETIADKAFAGMKFNKIEMKSVKSTSPYAKTIAYVNMADNFNLQTRLLRQKGRFPSQDHPVREGRHAEGSPSSRSRPSSAIIKKGPGLFFSLTTST